MHEKEQHQRYVMEREADAKASAAAALHEKTSELAALRDALDRCEPKPSLLSQRWHLAVKNFMIEVQALIHRQYGTFGPCTAQGDIFMRNLLRHALLKCTHAWQGACGHGGEAQAAGGGPAGAQLRF